jgi:hypothetical protein
MNIIAQAARFIEDGHCTILALADDPVHPSNHVILSMTDHPTEQDVKLGMYGLHIDIVGLLALEGYNFVQDIPASSNSISITLTPDAAAKLDLTGNLTVRPPDQNIDGKSISSIVEIFNSRIASKTGTPFRKEQ